LLHEAGSWLEQQFQLPNSPLPERVVTTLATLVLLHEEFAAEQSMWKRSAEKAIRHLARTLGLTHSALRTGITEITHSG
jgi:hypothetical protein